MFVSQKKLANFSWRIDANLPSALRLSIAALREMNFPSRYLSWQHNKISREPPFVSVRGGTVPIFFHGVLMGGWPRRAKKKMKNKARCENGRWKNRAEAFSCVSHKFCFLQQLLLTVSKGKIATKEERKSFKAQLSVNGTSAGFCQPFKGTFKERCEHTKPSFQRNFCLMPLCGVGKQGWFAVYGFCCLFFYCRLPVCGHMINKALKQQWRNSSHKTNTACLKTRAVLFVFLKSGDDHVCCFWHFEKSVCFAM